MNKDKDDITRVTATTDRLWVELRDHNEDIINYLSGGAISNNINRLFEISLKLVISELLIGREKYEKYPVNKFTTDDFIQMAVIDPTKKNIDYDNQEECEPFMEEVRAVMWGYIKQYYEELTDLFLSLNREYERDINDDEMDRLIECLCVTYIETNFRRRELYFLERYLE